ncbi:MAG TPA: hypothetical protein DCS93_32600 [Microscillaceae bacterium]|nr:hypothetical protein [Microscillaceae bacterium]
MSVILEFTQIETENIVSENKTLGIYEVLLDNISWLEGAYIQSNIISALFHEANNWGEVYFRPDSSQFLFYLLAVDFESQVGFRESDEGSVIIAFDPYPLKQFFEEAQKRTQYGQDGAFDRILEVLTQAILDDSLICTKWG